MLDGLFHVFDENGQYLGYYETLNANEMYLVTDAYVLATTKTGATLKLQETRAKRAFEAKVVGRYTHAERYIPLDSRGKNETLHIVETKQLPFPLTYQRKLAYVHRVARFFGIGKEPEFAQYLAMKALPVAGGLCLAVVTIVIFRLILPL